jgi:hypothetical protein
MESLFDLFKHLWSILSLSEFITVLTLIVGISLMIVKLLIKFLSKSNMLSGMMRDDSATNLDDIAKQLDKTVTSEQHTVSIDRILDALQTIKSQYDNHDELMRNQITEILLLKNDVESLSEGISRDLDEIKNQLRQYELHAHQSSEGMKDIVQRCQDLMQRIISQIDKIDEFTRAAIPEFRSYHKELSKEVSELNRDIALVERTIQSQINTSKAINLR